MWHIYHSFVKISIAETFGLSEKGKMSKLECICESSQNRRKRKNRAVIPIWKTVRLYGLGIVLKALL